MSAYFTTVAWFFSLFSAVYTLYFFIIALFGLKKNPQYPKVSPQSRFAVLIAARNEELVVGQLVESLVDQNYPRELYDIIVLPNNCIDNTAQTARQAGATIWECSVPVHSKGQVLSFAVDRLLQSSIPYDAICIFDADNLAHPNFLLEMNNARMSGVQVAQGLRDSKNPYDSLISGCSSIYYWMLNKFYNSPRQNIGLSSAINGSGFMVDLELLRQWGGWNTSTLIEDVEFTGQCVLRGIKVGWVPTAITYDEQPLTFIQSWQQRKRWSTGMLQCLEQYAWSLIKAIHTRNLLSLDILLLYLCPIMQIIFLIPTCMGYFFHLLDIPYGLFPETHIYYQLFFSLSVSFLGTFITAFASVISAKKPLIPMMGAILFYWVFILSWLPINCICLVRREKNWKPIPHTRSIHSSQLFEQTIR